MSLALAQRTYLTFRADGHPKGQPRGRACRRGAHAGIYDPGTADEWKAIVVAAGRPHRPAAPIEGPLCVGLSFWLPRPKGRCRRADPQGAIPCTTKPDVDNLAKAVLDAMTQDGWWHDDAQVCDLSVIKRWHAIGERAGLSVAVISVVAP